MPDAADAGLEAAGGGGLAVADLQGGLDVIHRAQLRRLQHLGAASLMTACNSALGSVVEKSALDRWPRLDSGIGVPVVVLVPVVVRWSCPWWWWCRWCVVDVLGGAVAAPGCCCAA